MSGRSRWQTIVAILVLACLVPGCVRRRVTIRTNPPGAMIYMDRQPLGPSPVSTSITYYGTRHIEAVGDGYRTEKVLHAINPPWYEIPPLDFVSEVLWPWEIRDQRVIDITMVPDPIAPSEELIARGDELRGQVAAGIAVPIGQRGSVPGNVPSGQVLPPPGTVVPVLPAEPQVLPPVMPQSTSPGWRPGQFLRNFLQPGGQPVQSIPEVQGLQGGGYRPALTP